MIGVIAAMDSEMLACQALMSDVQEEKVGNMTIYTGKMAGVEMALVKSGVGKVMAAMAATALCMKYPLKLILNVGVAGGLLENQQVMDLVVSSRAVQADFDSSPLDGPAGVGLMFTADQKALNTLEPILMELDIPYHIGLIATQDLFMARPADYDRLMANFPESACSEMEGAAVAAVADSFRVPFLIIRSLSDVTHHSDNPMEFSQFQEKAALRAASLLEAYCKAVSGNQ